MKKGVFPRWILDEYSMDDIPDVEGDGDVVRILDDIGLSPYRDDDRGKSRESKMDEISFCFLALLLFFRI